MIYKLFSLLAILKCSTLFCFIKTKQSTTFSLHHSEYNNIYFLYTIQYFFYFFTKTTFLETGKIPLSSARQPTTAHHNIHLSNLTHKIVYKIIYFLYIYL